MMTANDWKVWLEQQIIDNKECGVDNTPAEALASIFEITTYDGDADKHFVEKILEVLEVIDNRKTFEYIEANQKNYFNFLMVVNFPVVAKLISWGTSIRGAWFESRFDKPFKPVEGLIMLEGVKHPEIVGADEMTAFIQGAKEFLKTEITE